MDDVKVRSIGNEETSLMQACRTGINKRTLLSQQHQLAARRNASLVRSTWTVSSDTLHHMLALNRNDQDTVLSLYPCPESWTEPYQLRSDMTLSSLYVNCLNLQINRESRGDLPWD